MGIPGYFGYLKRKYNIMDKRKARELNVDTLMVDANSLIYDANHERDMEDGEDEMAYEADLIERVIQKIYELVNDVKPKKVTYIAFDGLAPLLKMEQQRMRRFLNRKSTGWNTNKITPGTLFMQKLSKRIKEIETDCLKISGADERGEGEQKLFKHLRETDGYTPVIMVHGKDADLIMLCLLHIKYADEIYIYRETDIININRLVNYLYYEMVPQPSQPSNTTQSPHRHDYQQSKNHNHYHRYTTNQNMNLLDNKEDKISKMDDYVFISYMKGNDFMEQILMCQDEEVMLWCYRKLGKPIIMKTEDANGQTGETGQTEINNENFIEYIRLMAEREHEVIVRIRKERDRESKRAESTIECLPIKLLSAKELEVRELEKGWEKRYEMMNEVDKCYKKHMKWMKEYNEGKEVKRNRKRERMGPLMKMLLEEEGSSSSSEEEMDECDQLVYVLPKEDRNLLQELGIENVNERIYEEEKEIDWTYKRRIWESKVKLKRIRKRGEKEGEEKVYEVKK